MDSSCVTLRIHSSARHLLWNASDSQVFLGKNCLASASYLIVCAFVCKHSLQVAQVILVRAHRAVCLQVVLPQGRGHKAHNGLPH
jgi:hypothetical protein